VRGKIALEALEPRILLSADPLLIAVADAHLDDPSVQTEPSSVIAERADFFEEAVAGPADNGSSPGSEHAPTDSWVELTADQVGQPGEWIEWAALDAPDVVLVPATVNDGTQATQTGQVMPPPAEQPPAETESESDTEVDELQTSPTNIAFGEQRTVPAEQNDTPVPSDVPEDSLARGPPTTERSDSTNSEPIEKNPPDPTFPIGGLLELSAESADLTIEFLSYNSVAVSGSDFHDGIYVGVWEIRSGRGSDTLIGLDADWSWILISDDSGSVAGTAFSGVENLIGGSGADTFLFGAGATLTGTIDGGAGVNTLDYSFRSDAVTVDLAAGAATGVAAASNIRIVHGGGGDDNLTGGPGGNLLLGGPGDDTLIDGQGADLFDGGPGNDTLVALVTDHTWTVTGLNSGALDAQSFESIENLVGGLARDEFLLGDGADLTGTIDGGGGGDTLSYAARSTPVTVDLVQAIATATGGISRILNLTGGQAADTLVGPDGALIWNLTGAGAGEVNGIEFTRFENLQGDGADDRFVFATGATLGGTIQAGGGTLDYAAYATSVTVDLAAGTATGTAGISGIGAIIGTAATDTLSGPAGDTIWTLTGLDVGDAGGIPFIGFENLTGAADNEDTFVFQATAGLSGHLEGGAGGFDSIVFDGGEFDTIVYNFTSPDSGSIIRDGDVLTYSGFEPISTLPDPIGPNPTTVELNYDIAGTLTISGAAGQVTVDSTTTETVTFDNPTVSLTINASDGVDVIVIQALDGFDADLIVNAGDGGDEIELHAITGSGTYTFNGGLGWDTITVRSSTPGTVNASGGPGYDDYVFEENSSTVTVTEGATEGDDTYFFGDGWGAVTIDDGGGTAVLDFSAFTGSLDLRVPNATDAEVVDTHAPANRIDFGGGATFTTSLAISQEMMVELAAGLAALAELGRQLDESGLLNEPLALLFGRTIGQLVSTEAILDTLLTDPVNGLMPDVRLEEVLAALNRSDTVGNLEFTVAASATWTTAGVLTLDLTIENATLTLPAIDLDLGGALEGLLVADGLTGDLIVDFGPWALSVGVDASGEAPVFFGSTTDDITLMGGINLDPLQFDRARAGVLGLEIGTVGSNDSSLDFDFGDSGITIETGALDFQNLDVADLTLEGTAWLDMDLYAQVVGVARIGDDPNEPIHVFFEDEDNLFDAAAPIVIDTYDVALPNQFVSDFFKTDSVTILNQLIQFRDFLGIFDTKVLNLGIPLTEGKTVGDLIDLAGSFRQQVLDPIEVQAYTETTPVSALNRGRGIRTVSGVDFHVSLSDGTTSFDVDLDLSPTDTVSDLIQQIEDAAPGTLVAAGTFEVRIDEERGGLSLLDRTGGTEAFEIVDRNLSPALTDLGLGGQGSKEEQENGETALVIAADIGFPGPNFDTLQEMAANLDTTVGALSYDVATHSVSFTLTVGLIGAELTDTLVLFDAGPLTDLVVTNGEVTLTPDPEGTLTLPLELLLTDIGFTVDETIFVSDLNAGDGVRTAAGEDDIRVQLIDGRSFVVDLDHDPASLAVASLNNGQGLGTTGDSAFDIQLRLGNGAMVDVDLDPLPATLGDLMEVVEASIPGMLVADGKFAIRFDDARGTLALLDATGQSTALELVDINDSTAGSNLGLAGTGTWQVINDTRTSVLEVSLVTLGDLMNKIRMAATEAGLMPTDFAVGITDDGHGLQLVDRTTAAAPITGTVTGDITEVDDTLTGADFGPVDGLVGRSVFLETLVTDSEGNSSVVILSQRIIVNTATVLTLEVPWQALLPEGSSFSAAGDPYEIPTTFDVAALNESAARIGLGLIGPGGDQVLGADSSTDDANARLGVNTTGDDNPDIQVRLSDGVTVFDVDLDPLPATLADILSRIEAAARDSSVAEGEFEARIAEGTGLLSLVDRILGDDPFTVVDLPGSTAAFDLGLTRAGAEQDTDVPEDGVADGLVIELLGPALLLEGNVLHGDTAGAHVGVRMGSLSTEVEIDAPSITADGLWGALSIGVTGGFASGDAVVTVEFADPGTDGADDLALLRELTEGLGEPSDLIKSHSAGGSLSLTLPLRPDDVEEDQPFAGVSGDDPMAQVTVSDITDASGIDVTLTSSDDNAVRDLLEAVVELTIDDILAALRGASDYLIVLETDPMIDGQENRLTTRLPGLGVSIAEVFGFGQIFANRVAQLEATPPETLQELQPDLNALADFSEAMFDLVVTPGDPNGTPGTKALTLDLVFDLPTLVRQLDLLLDLEVFGVDLESRGLELVAPIVGTLLEATQLGRIDLALEIDLSTPAAPVSFLSDTTTMSFDLEVDETDLTFATNMGKLMVEVTGGSFRLDPEDPELYWVTLLDDPENHRYAFADAAAATSVMLDGSLQVMLPIHFPDSQGVLSPEPEDSLNVTVPDLANVTSTSTRLAGPDVRARQANVSLLENLDSFRIGFDRLFFQLDRALDEVIFSQALPLVGSQLADAIDFIDQMRAKVADNLGLIIGTLTPDKAKQALFDGLGPGGLGWLCDISGDGKVKARDDIVVAASADEVVFELDLFVPQQVLERPVDLDLNLPGLGLQIDAPARVEFGFRTPLTFRFGIDTFGAFIDVSTLSDVVFDIDVTLPDGLAMLSGETMLTFEDNGQDPDTISRDSGSWILDGFVKGQRITVAGPTDDAIINDGSYVIAGIDPTGETITLVGADPLTNEGPIESEGVSITSEKIFSGKMGFLPYRVFDLVDKDDTASPTRLQGFYTIDLTEPSGNDRLSAGELRSRPADQLVGGSFTGVGEAGGAEINLWLETNLPAGAAFPPYRMNLEIDWSFGPNDPEIGDSSTLTIEFNDVQFELVRFMTDFAGAALTRLRTAFEPFDWLITTLNFELFPILSLFYGNATYVNAVNTFGGTSEVGNFAGAAEAIRDIVERLPSLTGAVWIDLGAFSVVGDLARLPSAAILGPTPTHARSFGSVGDKPLALTTNPDLDFVSNTVTRQNDAEFTGTLTFEEGYIREGSWTGFAVRDYITITGTNGFDGLYRIDKNGISGDELFLDPTYGDYTQNFEVDLDYPVTFDHVTVKGYIQTWISEGFEQGQSITIEGAGDNDDTYQITGVSADVLTLNATLTTQAAVSAVSIQILNSDGKPAATILGQIGGIATDRCHPSRSAGLDFVRTQMLPGRKPFTGGLGSIPDFFVDVYGLLDSWLGAGIDPLELPIIEDVETSFRLLLGETDLENFEVKDSEGNITKESRLLRYGTPELFVQLYEEIPLDGKFAIKKLNKAAAKLTSKYTAGVEWFIPIALEARADFQIEFDTTGLETFRSTGNPDDIVNGLFFDDYEGVEDLSLFGLDIGASKDQAQATILFGVGLGLQFKLDLGFAEFKVGLQLLALIGGSWNFNDPGGGPDGAADGKIRAQEFDRNATVDDGNVYDWSLRTELRVDFFIVFSLGSGWFTLTVLDIRVNILTLVKDWFTSHDLVDPPALATAVNGVLQLGFDTAASEAQTLYVGPGSTADSVIVSGFKHSRSFSGISRITGSGGSGDDTLIISDEVTIPVEFDAGGGNDRLIAGGGTYEFYGEAGDDFLQGGDAGGTLDGGDNDDTIRGGNGIDLIFGGPGDDRLFGWRGDDEISGGLGIDTIDGGTGRNFISDVSADKSLSSTDDGDFIRGGPDIDIIEGGPGPDTIWGGDGADIIRAGDDRDTVFGGMGNDDVDGGPGEDTIFGDRNNDLIRGGDDNDLLDGGGGSDQLFGDGGPGRSAGTGGDDLIVYEEGNTILDGEDGSDVYLLFFEGDKTDSLITVLDSGDRRGTDLMVVTGTALDDQFLLRANTDGSLAFVAMLNSDSRVERINYTGLERIVVNGGAGHDDFAVDDTAAEVTLNGESGNDTFQVGQLFRSERSEEYANVSVDDVFATIQTTRGFLSDGIGAPMTINGGLGNDEFVVFHNKAVLTLNGDQGEDVVEVRAFALTGSQEPQRERTDISGGAGADLVQYAVNAPVNVDGGDGLDKLVVFGTEFGDDFVITEDGVFGAGLTINFVNIELLRVDGAEGDDRFYVKSTSEKFITELFDGLGSDTFNMSGDTPPVISNDLLGHSGLVLQSVESMDERFDEQTLFGISANVADNDEPFAVIRESGGSTIVTEGGSLIDSYEVVLTRKPDTDVFVKALAPIPTPDNRELRELAFRLSSPSLTSIVTQDGSALTLVFTPENWFLPQIVEVRADNVPQWDVGELFTRPELGDSGTFNFDDDAFEGVRFGVVNHLVLAGSDSIQGNPVSIVGSPTLIIANPNNHARGDFIGRMITVRLADDVTIQKRLVVDAEVVGDDIRLILDRAWRTGPGLPDGTSTFDVPLNGETETGHPLAAGNPTITIPNPGDVAPIELVGRRVEIISGMGAGQSRFIIAAVPVAGNLELTLDRGWSRTNVPAATRDVERSETKTGNVFAPNVLTFTFDVGAVTPAGPGVITVSTIADLDALGELFALDVEGLEFNRFETDGLQFKRVTTTIELTREELEERVDDAKIIIIVTPSADVGDLSRAYGRPSELTIDLSFPVPDSEFLVRIDDAFVGKMSGFDEMPAALPPVLDPEDDRSTFTDNAASFPIPRPADEGLTGAILQIVGGPGAGQERLILGHLATDPAHTLILSGPWATNPVPGESVYRIERYDGLAIPSVQVQVNDNDEPGVIVDETRGFESGAAVDDFDTITTLIEGGDGDHLGEKDVLEIRLTRAPDSLVVVDLLFDGAQLELTDLTGNPISSLQFNSGNWNMPRHVVVSATADLLREGFHTSLIEFDVSMGSADSGPIDRTDTFVVIPEDEPVLFVGLTREPIEDSVEVTLNTELLAEAVDYEVRGNNVIFLDGSDNPRAVSGELFVSYKFIEAGFFGTFTTPVLARIADADAPTVLVRESGGSTDVVEFDATGLNLAPVYSRSQTTNDGVFYPNTLIFEFDVSSVRATGGGVLTVEAVADLGLNFYPFFFESLSLDAEGIFPQPLRLFASDGADGSRVTTTIDLSQAQIEALAADGTITFEVTPSFFVGRVSNQELTLELEFPAIVASRLSETRLGSVSHPNVLTYEFDVGSLDPTGDGLLTVSATADLDGTAKFLTIDAENLFSESVSQSGTTTFDLSAPLLDELAADGKITFTVTPSPAVTGPVDNEQLTLQLDFPATVRTETAHQDTYELVLTGAPTDPVTVTVTPDITKTTRTGGIRHDEIQVAISSSDARVVPEMVAGQPTGNLLVTFTAADWDDPVEIRVAAIDDDFVDGGDTKEFAPGPNTLSGILGPVFIDGEGGQGSLATFVPVLLPGEINVKDPEETYEVDSVVGTQVTVTTVDLEAILDDLDLTAVEQLVGKTLEITAVTDAANLTHSAIGQFRLIVDVDPGGPGQTVLTINESYNLGPDESESDILSYAVTSESFNFFIDETTQVDFLFVHDEDSPADSTGVLTPNRLFGLNMGPDLVLGGKLQPGGITYACFEVLEINLGIGNNDFTVLGTPTRVDDGYQTWTFLNTGDDLPFMGAAGDTVTVTLNAVDEITASGVVTAAQNADTEAGIFATTATIDQMFADGELAGQLIVADGQTRRIRTNTGNVLTLGTPWNPDALPTGQAYQIKNEADGAFAVNGQGGDDTIDATASTLGIVAFGGLGNDTIFGTPMDDILFGDRGRVDFIDANGAIVTRLGDAPEPITGLVTEQVTLATLNTLTDGDAAFRLPDLLADGLGSDDIGLIGLFVDINSGNGFLQKPLLITGNNATMLTLWPGFDPDVELPGPDAMNPSQYRISTRPENQTDGVVRQANLLLTVDNALGGTDTIDAGAGLDQIFGGAGDDTIAGGADDDVVLGDGGRIDRTRDPSAPTDLVVFDSDTGRVEIGSLLQRLRTIANVEGGTDTITGDGDQDVLIGGAAGDIIDGNGEADLIFGDNVELDRRTHYLVLENPRFRALSGTVIYGNSNDPFANQATVDGTPQLDPDGQPRWGDWVIRLMDHSLADETDELNNFGGDYIAGGPANDMIFGQLGDDTIQGDGSIAGLVDDGVGVTAERNDDGTLTLVPSFEATTDGDDYIEGNGGGDVIFGNLGQDDILGGSSDLFSLTGPEARPDGADTIFGGAGLAAARNDEGDTAIGGHARDADTILGDNGEILRLLGINGASTGNFLSFNYDNFSGSLRIIPRAAILIDYTPGGLDYELTAGQAASDIGAGDEIHGEAGDDFIYGTKGGDVLFGDGQDDDIVGGYDHDWVSGGQGQDGVIGDDGRIFTSRNVQGSGLSEPLYGVAMLAEVNLEIDTPGNLQQATINIPGILKKTVNLTPFELGDTTDLPLNPLFADDIIYGGLGSDFLHGSAGDDGISGAEALPEYFAAPANPGDVLGYGATDRANEFAAYDEFNPRRKILVDANGEFLEPGEIDPNAREFPLNFNQLEGPFLGTDGQGNPVHTDGDDILFGDLGNDWLVGGTGQDHSYGGFGDDLLNADDNHDSIGGGDPRSNDVPDTHPTYEDIAYGGAGRDVLIANTGGDRLIDWVGEFNSYIVPFAPFGPLTISRGLQPQLREYLYDLSENDGADPTRATDTGADADRNGEPEGEIGVVQQSDFEWRDQTGAPDDPQPGNIPGGPRDVLRSANFNTGTADGFTPDSGIWRINAGRFEVEPEYTGGDAVSVFYVDHYLPSYFELLATINAAKRTGLYDSNAYLIFDYQSEYDFRFAGINNMTKKLEMGHRNADGWFVDVQTPMLVKPDTDYNMLLSLHGVNATLVVDNQSVLQFTYEPRVVDGVSFGLNTGMVGIGARNSIARIDNVSAQILFPEVTFEGTEGFPDTEPRIAMDEETGIWTLDSGRYIGAPLAGENSAMNLVDLGNTEPFRVTSILEVAVVLNSETTSGIVFDLGSSRYKFAVMLPDSDQVAIGHVTRSGGLAFDAVADVVIDPGVDHTLMVSLKGTSVNLALDGNLLLGHFFNSVVVDGDFGLYTASGPASFDSIRMRTDDPAAESPAEQTAPIAPPPADGSSGSASGVVPVALELSGSDAGTEATVSGELVEGGTGEPRTGTADLGAWFSHRLFCRNVFDRTAIEERRDSTTTSWPGGNWIPIQ